MPWWFIGGLVVGFILATGGILALGLYLQHLDEKEEL